MAGQFQVYQDGYRNWRWRLVDPEGQLVADGAGIAGSKQEAREACEGVQRDLAEGAQIVVPDASR